MRIAPFILALLLVPFAAPADAARHTHDAAAAQATPAVATPTPPPTAPLAAAPTGYPAAVVEQKLVAPPLLPEHEQVASGGPKVVKVEMRVEEKMVQIAPDAEVWAMTYNGSVPGPAIVVHQNDWVELHLINPATNKLAHNIDFHAATGALGGGALTLITPGQDTILRFKATKSGAFVYHCAPGGEMIPLHVSSGMNGLILVLPRDGLKDEKGAPIKYDQAFYIGEQDYYLPKDEHGHYIHHHESVTEDMAATLRAMRGLIPTHLVFNGAKGALTGDNALKAKVGETVLMIHASANRDTRPHLIGGHADLFWPGGSFATQPQVDQETWPVAGGDAAVALYKFRQPGLYAYVNHNLIEAMLLGASAHIKVEGTWDDDLMKQVKPPTAMVPIPGQQVPMLH